MKNSMDFSASVKEALARVTIRDQAFIGGRYVPAASGETFECRTPIDGSLLTKIAACGEADADAAVAAARAAWSAPSAFTAKAEAGSSSQPGRFVQAVVLTTRAGRRRATRSETAR